MINFRIKLAVIAAALLLPFHHVLAAERTLEIAMLLWRGETPAERGFKEQLQKLGHKANFSVMDAAQDRGELGSVLRKTLRPRAGEFDYIYTFGTTVSKATQQMLDGSTPQLFNVVFDPVKAEIVSSLEAPGKNISGASNAVPIVLQLKTVSRVFEIKRLAFLFNPREKNSMVARSLLQQASKELNFELVELRSPPSNEALERNLSKLVSEAETVDAVFLPPDSFIASNAELIATKLNAAKIKSIGATKKYINEGALLGVVPDYYELGQEVAAILHRHRNGEHLSTIPVAFSKAPALVVNRATSERLGVVIPAGIKPQFVE